MRIHLSQTPRRLLALAIILAMLACLLPEGTQEASAAATLKNPQYSGETVTWDCVWFGHYPQSKDGNGGYKIEPIKWRVLSVDGNEALLLADKNLDAGMYHEEDTAVSWETSTIRRWLNGTGISFATEEFLGKAFNSTEQEAILEKTIKNPDNPKHGTAGGVSTKDKVFLLSVDEVTNPFYGFFCDGDSESDTRVALNTQYAISRGTEIKYPNGDYQESRYWWLRSPGGTAEYATVVNDDGCVETFGFEVDYTHNAIRPALRLNISYPCWSYAGTISKMTSQESPAPKQEIVLKPAAVFGLTLKAGKKRLNANWKKVEEASGYQILYAQDRKFEKGKKQIRVGREAKITIKNLKSKKTYYVKVRAYKKSGKKSYYGAFSKVRKVRIK